MLGIQYFSEFLLPELWLFIYNITYIYTILLVRLIVDGRDESQKTRSQLPSARLSGEKREDPTHSVQGQQNKRDRGQAEEISKGQKSKNSRFDKQSDGDES